MEDRIIDIIENLTGNEEIKKNKDIDLIENEILDSLAFIEFLDVLEEEFKIEVQPTQVDPNMWRSIKKISKYVESKV